MSGNLQKIQQQVETWKPKELQSTHLYQLSYNYVDAIMCNFFFHSVTIYSIQFHLELGNNG